MFDFGAVAERFDLGWLNDGESVLVARSPRGGVAIYDSGYRQRLELVVAAGGYATRGDREYPINGLLALRVWTEGSDELVEHDLRQSYSALKPI